MQGRTLLAINTDKSSLIGAMEWVCASGEAFTFLLDHVPYEEQGASCQWGLLS